MKTPFGFECSYFFGDYHRGKNVEECRLVGHQSPPHHWTAPICKDCPVPGILRANACTNMVIRGQIRSFLFGLKRRMTVSAYCTRVGKAVAEPHVGCGECHRMPEVFSDLKK